MTINTITRKLYVGTRDWALVCEGCAGHTLQSAIRNAKPGQTKFKGIDNETFELVDDQMMAVMVEDFAKYDMDVECDCQAGFKA